MLVSGGAGLLGAVNIGGDLNTNGNLFMGGAQQTDISYRIEAKSAQLSFDEGGQRRNLRFHGIKESEFDILLLAAYTPFGLHLFKHDNPLSCLNR